MAERFSFNLNWRMSLLELVTHGRSCPRFQPAVPLFKEFDPPVEQRQVWPTVPRSRGRPGPRGGR
eukprot:3062280-Pyramimonas_sp.AAC.1